MSEFFKTHKFKILAALISVLFGMMLYSASSEGVNNIPKNLLQVITTPFQQASTYISNSTGNFFDRFLNYKNTIEENEALKAENASLNQKLIDYEKVKDENEQYQVVAGIKGIYPDFEITMASVVSRDPSDRYNSFMIDKGTLHGVAMYDPVMTATGLIGIVTKVGPISARVKTILSPEIDVSVIEISSKELGVLNGDVLLSKEGLAKLSILSEDTVIKSGDMIITAGASGIYPKGIPIGKIVDVKSESHGITKYATVKPLDAIDEVTTVQVITKFNGQGSALIDYLDE
ncbi:MAG: rod shape-determining protein MreC [Oscillospiraceae bacterium]